MRNSAAGVVFVGPQVTLCDGRNFLVVDNPSRAFQQLLEAFHNSGDDASGFEGIHPTAIIHPTAKVGSQVSIGPYSVIDKQAQIGDRTVIQAHCYVGPHSKVGSDCTLHHRATVREHCTLGDRVILQPGAVIGSCGFGYTMNHEGRHIKLNQIGTVVLEDDVEIGANTAIDRARFKTTRIGRGTKIDNLVQIGHGVQVGQDNIIIAQTGIAGSTETGRHVILAGQVAVNGHIKIADQVVVSARSAVSKSITEAGKYGGFPAIPLNESNRNSVYLRNIETYVNQIKELKARLDLLEKR
jgi:UDP-3-O-[3-hydroxymyristoyl] glucosamine N-acyltransferase